MFSVLYLLQSSVQGKITFYLHTDLIVVLPIFLPLVHPPPPSFTLCWHSGRSFQRIDPVSSEWKIKKGIPKLFYISPPAVSRLQGSRWLGAARFTKNRPARVEEFTWQRLCRVGGCPLWGISSAPPQMCRTLPGAGGLLRNTPADFTGQIRNVANSQGFWLLLFPKCVA